MRYVFIPLLAVSLVSSLSARPKMTQMQGYYYDLGYNESKAEHMQAGYQKALDEFKVIVQDYKLDVEAQQAAKYMLKNGKITYPKIYKIREGDSYSIKITSPKVEPIFTPEDLFIIPLLEKGRLKYKGLSLSSKRTSSFSSGISDTARENSFGLPDLNTLNRRKNRPTTVRAIQKTNILKIKMKSAAIVSAMDKYHLRYTITPDGYDITFSDSREREQFCKDLTKDPTCSKLK